MVKSRVVFAQQDKKQGVEILRVTLQDCYI